MSLVIYNASDILVIYNAIYICIYVYIYQKSVLN